MQNWVTPPVITDQFLINPDGPCLSQSIHTFVKGKVVLCELRHGSVSDESSNNLPVATLLFPFPTMTTKALFSLLRIL